MAVLPCQPHEIRKSQKFVEQRIKLQQELEQLTPVDSNDLGRAVDLLKNFSTHWGIFGDNIDAQSEFIKQIVEQVYVQDKQVVAMTLRSNCHLVLSHKIDEPTEYTVDPFITDVGADPALYTSGGDGSRSITCTRFRTFLPKYLHQKTTKHRLTSNNAFSRSGYTIKLW